MELEAVWLKDEIELYCVNPVVELIAGDGVEDIVVNNGYAWYSSADCLAFCGEKPNGFMVREMKGNRR